MKVKPQQYAEMLVSTLTDAKGAEVKSIAANFWKLLQKNKQYKDLPKILELVDEESAKKNGQVLAKVYSEKELTAEELKAISDKLSAISKKPVVIKNIVKSATTGIIVKVEDKIVDLSLEDKIGKLRKKLNE